MDMRFLLSHHCSSTIYVFYHDPTRTLHTAGTALFPLFVLDQQMVLWHDCGMVGTTQTMKRYDNFDVGGSDTKRKTFKGLIGMSDFTR